MAQGKDHKVVAAQESTTQNSVNQGKKFDGKKQMFNAINEKDLLRVLDNFDFGIVKPSYIVNNLKMSESFIDKARIPDERKALLRNSFGFLLMALESSVKEHFEHIAEHYYPEDFEDTDLEGDDLKIMVCNEIDYIIADWDPSASGFKYYSEDWEDARNIIQAYMDVLDANGIEVPGWVIEGINERNAEFNV